MTEIKRRSVSDGERKEKVYQYLPTDVIVYEILQKLEIKTLFRFKAVSQLYNIVISRPNWGSKYLRLAYSSLPNWYQSGLRTSLMYPFTNQNTMKVEEPHKSICITYVTLPIDETHKILGSSRGLILSLYLHSVTDNENQRFGLCVSNPLTKQTVKLPELSAESLTNYSVNWLFGIVAKPVNSSFAYRVVLIAKPIDRDEIFDNDSIQTRSHIFSSDTGCWTSWNNLICPTDLFITDVVSFPHNSILHFEGFDDAIITYDPFNSPERFSQILLPNAKRVLSENVCQSMIYSGEYQALQFSQFKQSSRESSNHKFVWWKLVDYDKGEWRRVHSCVVSDMSYLCKRLIVVSNPFNRFVFCHPFKLGQKLMVFDCSKFGERAGKPVEMAMKTPQGFKKIGYTNPFIRIDYCPWSSPSFYAAQRS